MRKISSILITVLICSTYCEKVLAQSSVDSLKKFQTALVGTWVPSGGAVIAINRAIDKIDSAFGQRIPFQVSDSITFFANGKFRIGVEKKLQKYFIGKIDNVTKFQTIYLDGIRYSMNLAGKDLTMIYSQGDDTWLVGLKQVNR